MSTCNHAPGIERGAYRHWRCQLRRNHVFRHRMNSYVWGRVVRKRVRYAPTGVDRRVYRSRHPRLVVSLLRAYMQRLGLKPTDSA